ncbi:MAG: type 1 glutamine amidotransferase [Thermodesulfobacteriota bacterium]
MNKRACVFQHTPWEGPGRNLLAGCQRHGLRLEIVRVWQERIPDLTPYAALIVLGGSPNVDEEDRYPFLRPEKEAIARSLADDRPYLGFCLGHQLLADALGARVGKNFTPSLGFITGHVTEAGREHPALAHLDHRFPLFKWHGQTVLEPLPHNLTVLMTSAECQVEAIGVAGRPHLLGLQFDNHAGSPEEVAGFLASDRSWFEAMVAGKDLAPERILADARQHQDIIAGQFHRFFDNFVTLAGIAPAGARKRTA